MGGWQVNLAFCVGYLETFRPKKSPNRVLSRFDCVCRVARLTSFIGRPLTIVIHLCHSYQTSTVSAVILPKCSVLVCSLHIDGLFTLSNPSMDFSPFPILLPVYTYISGPSISLTEKYPEFIVRRNIARPVILKVFATCSDPQEANGHDREDFRRLIHGHLDFFSKVYSKF